MEKLSDNKLTLLPFSFLIVLVILWKVTQSVTVGTMVILFWMSWRQLLKHKLKI